MHSTIFLWAGLILLGLISINQCRRADDEESDEMILNKRSFRPVARHAQRYDYETLLKRMDFQRRKYNNLQCSISKLNR
jgi:hypothetical protein